MYSLSIKKLLLGCAMLWPAIAGAQQVPNDDSLDIMIGQMIMMGIEDRKALQPSDPLIQELKQGKLGGVMLYAKNFSTTNKPDSLKQLIKSLQSAAAVPLFVAIDEEGGRVHRLKEKDGFVAMPAASHLGKINNLDSTRYYNKRLATKLHEVGFNVNFAPSVDLALNLNNTVIVLSDRSYSDDPLQAARHARVAIKAHRESGVTAVAKHFPGHGSSDKDSHKWLVDVTPTWRDIELQPFQELINDSTIEGIMMAHIINQKWDNRLLPATLSDSVINYLLRDKMGYDGVVFTDDMQMDAIQLYYGLEKGVELAINAGADVLMFANTTRLRTHYVAASQMHSMIKKLVAEGKVPKARIAQSYRRIMALKRL
jgi:Beta-glucosidase-related glycosidases